MKISDDLSPAGQTPDNEVLQERWEESVFYLSAIASQFLPQLRSLNASLPDDTDVSSTYALGKLLRAAEIMHDAWEVFRQS